MADDGGEVLGFDALFSFQGRVNRGTFWKLFFLVVGGVAAALAVAFLMLPRDEGSTIGLGSGGTTGLVVFGAIYVAAVWINLATAVKRWHDMDKSAWFILFNLIPAVNFLALLYLGFNPGTQGPNRFGAAPVRILF